MNNDVILLHFCDAFGRRKKAMIFSKDDRILIKVLRQSMGYSARKLLEEFPDKDWSCSALDRLLQQILQLQGLQTGSPAAAENVRSAQ